MDSRPGQPKRDQHWPAALLSVRVFFLFILLIAALPLGADISPDNSIVTTLVAELLPGSAEAGFTDLSISKARSLRNLTDSASLITSLIAADIRAADRRALYVELASIQELLGRYEEAATSWEAAIAAQPGQGETAWLLSAAACRLAIGDADAAVALAKAALLTTANPGLIAQATLIEARILMLAGDMASSLAKSKDALALGATGFEAAALSLARDSSSGAEREAYEKQLKEKHSGWPETDDTLASIQYNLVGFDPAQSVAPRIPVPAATAVPDSTTVAVPQAAGREEASGPLYYQLGAFRDEANAALLATRLDRAGFKPKTIRRQSGTGVLSIVYLDAGTDPARLMIALKDAGFESWPLFAAP